MASESRFEAKTCDEIEELFPGCIILKNDSGRRQGIPDRIILFENKWAVLEFKDSEDAEHQPNQDWYIEHLNSMSYASFIYPKNKDQVLYELQQTFRTARPSRLFEPVEVSLDKLPRRKAR